VDAVLRLLIEAIEGALEVALKAGEAGIHCAAMM